MLVFPAGSAAAFSRRQPPSGQAPSAQTPPEAVVEVPPAPEPVVIVEGQVTNFIGAGVEGVTITARYKPEDDRPGEVIGTATSDAMGDFRITAPSAVRGDIVVSFSNPQYAELTREVHVGDDEFPPYLAETLEGKLVTAGRVIDALTDRPVAQASVRLTAQYKEWSESTDEEGRFTIRGVFPGRGDLVVEAKRYGREHWTIPTIEDKGEVTVRLKPERIVHMTTTDEEGGLIAGVTVECYDAARHDFRTVVTGEDGKATIHGVHFDADAIGVRLTHRDYVSDTGFDREILTPADQAESSHSFVMIRAGHITGRVTDAQTGEPVHGARVMTGDEYTDVSPRDWVDHEGKYAVDGVPPGRVTVTVHASGHAPDLKTTEVAAGGTANLDFSLQAGPTLSGVVKDSEGKPAVRAYVEASRWRDRSTLGLRAVTDDRGGFRIHDAPVDEFEVVVFAEGYLDFMKTVKADPAAEIEFVLSPMSDAGLARTHTPQVGDAAPDATFTTLEGRTLTLSALKGKTVLLDFWATWCPPCIEEMPHLITVHERFGSRDDFVMIGISRDYEKASLTRFLEKNEKVGWPQVFGDSGGVKAACELYRVQGVPRVFLIGPDGRILANSLRGEQIVPGVERAIQGEPPE